MRMFMFKSEGKIKLHALTGDPGGQTLPTQHGPWHAVGVVREDSAPPHRLNRAMVEQTIGSQGFLLYRMKTKSLAP